MKTRKPYRPAKSLLCGPFFFSAKKSSARSRAVYAFFFPAFSVLLAESALTHWAGPDVLWMRPPPRARRAWLERKGPSKRAILIVQWVHVKLPKSTVSSTPSATRAMRAIEVITLASKNNRNLRKISTFLKSQSAKS